MVPQATDIESLLPAITAGEAGAYRTLVRALSGPLYRYVGFIVREPETAQDVVQQTFIRLYRSRARLEPGGTLRGYCYRVAANLAKNALRDSKLRRERENEAPNMREPSNADPERAAIAREAWRLVYGLPQELSQPLVLRFEHGLTLSETAQALSLPEGTVSTRQRAGLERLRERLGANLSLPATLGLQDLLASFTHSTSVAVSSSLITSVETTVMASIGTKTLSSTAIAIIVLLLLAGGGTGAWMVFGAPRANERHARNNEELAAVQDSPGKDNLGASARDHGKPDATGDAGSTKNARPLPPEPARDQGDGPGFTPAPTPVGTSAHNAKAKVSGRVVNTDLKPLEHIHVSASLGHRDQMYHLSPEASLRVEEVAGHVTTDKDGYFTLDFSALVKDVEGPLYFTLVANVGAVRGMGPQYVSTRTPNLWVMPDGTLQNVVIVMNRPASIYGTVQDRHNNPVKDARVVITAGHHRGSQSMLADDQRVVISAQDGSFRFANIPPGTYDVGILPKGIESPSKGPNHHSLMSSRVMSVGEGGCSGPVKLVLNETVLRFKVTPTPDKLNANFSVHYPEKGVMDQTEYRSLQPATDGSVEIVGLHPGVRSMELSSNRYGTARREIRAVQGQDLDLGLIELEHGLSVHGLVLGSDGRPAGTLMLTCGLENKNRRSDRYYFATGPDGKFHQSGLEAGRWRITARGFPNLVAEGVMEASPPDAPGLTLTLAPGGNVVSGHVTVGGRAPTPAELGATGLSESIEVRLYPGNHTESGVRARMWSHTNSSVADHTGRYEFVFVEPGTYTLAAVLGRRMGVRSGIVVSADKTALRFNLDIPPASSVSGRIIGRDGQPAANMQVRLSRFSMATFSFDDDFQTVTDDKGEYHFENVAADSYFLRLAGDGDLMSKEQLAARAVRVAPGQDTRKDLDLSEGGGLSISGQATIGGKPEFNEVAMLKPGDIGSLRSVNLDGKGQFILHDVRPGVYYLWFVDSKLNPKHFARETVRVNEDESVRLSRHYPAASLTGRIRIIGDDSLDLAKVKVRVSPVLDDKDGADPVAMMAVRTVDCDAEGRFSFESLVGGKYLVTATAPGLPPVTQPHELSGPKTLEFLLGGEAGELALTIKQLLGDDTAEPIVKTSALSHTMLLSLWDAEGKPVTLSEFQRLPTLDVGLVHRLDALPLGKYRIELSGMHIERWTGSFTISSGKTTPLEAVLRRAAVIRLNIQNPELDAAAVQRAKVQVFDAADRPVPLGADLTSAFGIEPEAAAGKVIKLTPLNGGTYRVVVSLEGYQPVEARLNVEPSAVTEHSLTLVR